MRSESKIYGMLAEFATPEAVVAAAREVHAQGYHCVEAYTPFPVTELNAALKHPKSRVPLVVLIGAIIGGSGAFFMCWYANVISYRWNVGGKPPNSWPAFIPITFELAVLCASLAAVLGMLALCGLPRPYHPLFNVEDFAAASRNRFFLCVETADPKYETAKVRQMLEQLSPLAVMEVPTR
jgi:hypothetical protein